ncbi:hypothetical protein HAZT_HAZT003310 [Hyalella azteca]|uniref:Uncharacterized protein n=1 Tax=Hyalella azteca TaxID=294128 RepID=A0A6A0H4Y0_HYAAZ|nr:hypothetical protein HAZT_HAZT003310 [Hyalella azteca]
MNISKDGEHLLCDNISNIAVVDVSTGQAAKKNPNVTATIENKDIVSLPENDDEDEGPEDAFKNARIEMDEADGVTSFKLSPDGTKLIIATKTLLLKLYSWPDRTLIKQFRSYHRAHITCLDWDLSSTLVVSGSADQTARVWDTRRSCSTHSLRDTVGVFGCVTFHSNLQENPYVYAGVMTVLCAWKLSAGSSELVHKFDSAHFMNITCIEVTRDGKHLVSCGLDRIVILWNAAPMEQVKVVMVGQAVGAAVVLPKTDETEGVSVLLGGETGNLSIWRVDSGKEVLRTPKPLVEPIPGDERGSLCITGMMLCPALKSVVVSSYDNNILFVHTEHLKLWKMFCGYNEQVLATIFVTSLPAKKKKEKKEKCNVDGGDHSFLVVATNSSQLRLYRLSDMSCRLLHGHTDGVMALAKHPHLTDVFASSSRDESVRVWRVTDDFDAVCVAVASGHTHRVAAIALGMDILISGSKDTCIKRWLINEEKLTVIKKELLEEAKKKRSKDAAIKQELISSADAMVPNSLVCAATQVGHEKDINCICVAPKDKLVATASEDRTIKVWSGDRLSLEGTLRGHKRGVWSVQFSPVDKLLVSSSADGTLAIWLLESMTLAKTLSGHECGVLNVSWLNRGLQLVSTSASGIVKIWEVKTSTCLDSLSAHDEQRVWAVDVSHDGEKIVTGGEDSKIIVWRDVTQTVLAKQAEEKQRIESEQQTLANLMREQRWAEALVFTLKLDQPFNSLKVMHRSLLVRND